ncbi:hypothetical protein ANCDUO_15719 [Ancylostoma duodenale]|uniref:Uncharacterized protein n=1 Tax=Ancylostoma duodenale TaxID=51022 RepID=A0A0C2FZS7_9BILA|nr:hypothetical protein ANCDUO_15719 [Ancylostoma duodenale]
MEEAAIGGALVGWVLGYECTPVKLRFFTTGTISKMSRMYIQKFPTGPYDEDASVERQKTSFSHL